MNEHIINQWNSTIGKDDLVYHLGDFAFGEDLDRIEQLIKRLNGRITLIVGNHDEPSKIQLYSNYFKIAGARAIRGDQVIMTHYPINEYDFQFKTKINIHGHIHCGIIKDRNHKDLPDSRYINVSYDREFKIYRYRDLIAEK